MCSIFVGNNPVREKVKVTRSELRRQVGGWFKSDHTVKSLKISSRAGHYEWVVPLVWVRLQTPPPVVPTLMNREMHFCRRENERRFSVL